MAAESENSADKAFNDLSVKQLKTLVKAKAQTFDNENKRRVVLGIMEKSTEKRDLLNLAKDYVKVDEIDSLLKNYVEPPAPVKISDAEKEKIKKMSKEEKDKIKAALGSGGNRGGNRGSKSNMNMPNADQLRRQAREMRKNPDAVRRAHPQFAKMTTKEIHAYADQLEQMAKNPSMMRDVMNQQQAMSAMSDEDRGAIQELQEGLTGKVPRDDAWIGKMVRLVKKNPDMLKMLFKGRLDPKAGLSEDNVNSFIDYMVTFSDSTLKTMASTVNYLVESWPAISAFYKRCDDAMLGTAKYVVMAVVAFIVYMFCKVAWFCFALLWSLVRAVYGMLMGTASAPAAKVAAAGVASKAASAADAVPAAKAAPAAKVAAAGVAGKAAAAASKLGNLFGKKAATAPAASLSDNPEDEFQEF